MTTAPPRQRLAREDRYRQLIASAWTLVKHEGMDALTLGRLAEQAGVAKPVVYDHFGSRNGLISALYLDFEARQEAIIDAAIAATPKRLDAMASVIAATYVDCALAQGRELPGIVGALAGAPELELVRRECADAFHEKCRRVLAPFAPAGQLAPLRVRAMLGAAEALSYAAVAGEITPAQARAELQATIALLVTTPKAPAPHKS
ncbi:AcrR family transcriptional regulator [Variovorax sp. TBS-050B]|uniref:TetR/AcrR family transcriptional regulator n=1 Tax=Variovorax sp. TBS-050B TaxID=2940551 RepID=UPI002473238D|nr:TetR/AcrR family transcriptional regulator [Variovorax sp. TBS-050B]MDH6591284.1 AcrR family transcriptional regulator [Variovorax sp. TBS-050B]